VPNPLAYSRRRRLVLQTVMVLVLAGTMGIAAIVRQVKIGPSGVPLTRLIPVYPVRMRLPDWELTELKGLPSNQDGLKAVERNAAGQATGRVLEYRQEQQAQVTKADAYLISTFKLPPGTQTDTIKMVGTRGAFARVDAPRNPPPATRPSDDDASESQVLACAVLQGKFAFTVRLTVSGRPLDDRDVALLQQVAKTIQLISMDEGSLAALRPR
jgi:hypothetical protein